MTPQEELWKGRFGDDYTERNALSPEGAAALRQFWYRALTRILEVGLTSIAELGCNTGDNLLTLQTFCPTAALAGIEINGWAIGRARKRLFADVVNHPEYIANGGPELIHGSILTEHAPQSELAFTKGVLIHIAPVDLPRAYENLYLASSRYILVAEYYSRQPQEIEYRGHAGALWKRDFAGEMMDRYPTLRLVDYGFVYHRAPEYPQDDITWFLMEKTNG